MCRNPASKSNESPMILTSVSSYVGEKGGLPPTQSMIATAICVIIVLIAVELSLRQFFLSIQHIHPLLEDETNRFILARHIGVDSLSCFAVAILGYMARHLLQDIYDTAVLGKKSMPVAAFDKRLYTYHPESTRICLIFLAYQVKNLYDTIMWGDGPEFIMHHILCLFTGWGALTPGSAHSYIPFYFGVSEISTAVLCLLANFDDDHGAIGLAEAWPAGKMALGGIFAVLFVICRVFMWSTVSFYYCRDAWNALSMDDPRMLARKTWLRFTFVSLGLLSVLQIVWLGQIVLIGKEEMEKFGLLSKSDS